MSEEKKKRLAVEDDMVVTLSYTLKVDDQVVDTSDEGDDLQFIQGAGEILPALEEQLYGMQVGDTKQLKLQPLDGYGEVDPEAFAKIPRADFPKEIPLKAGVELELKDDDNETHYARVESVSKDQVTLNFNHPLAGKELDFTVRVVALRVASVAELDHGHVHTHPEHE
jgi:FKBP-type peptidyl-prolyl cis-trans isomerase SlyD